MAIDNRGRITKGGAGGFLSPPGHPEHSLHVETDLRRRPENRGSLSLRYAAEEATWLDPSTRSAARQVLKAWAAHRPPLESPEIQDWIHQVLGYFRDQYAGMRPGQTGSKWNVSNLRTISDIDPVLNADLHAGVNLIRRFYPEYTPSHEDFKQAYWGQRKASGNHRRR
jgi:hypothetical protein